MLKIAVEEKKEETLLSESEFPDSSSEEDDYQLWTEREKKRIKSHISVEKDETNDKAPDEKQKVAYNFMQRYYHRGAFYQQDATESGDADLAESAQ